MLFDSPKSELENGTDEKRNVVAIVTRQTDKE
jgi:hypothetical protein